ncbi:hypothetical protein [Aequorivita echinoideorum]|uniref:Lipoprotein n=1 Tax=Aequorivita echinoideorum TaxID=1549647 RepID=A0ABS5S4Q9_9FLAO|nr:hypothetical protein [Aequorivita echinoideorum]MBT0608198.1 hypothetical protein [Aequorivita echinoideorum]
MKNVLFATTIFSLLFFSCKNVTKDADSFKENTETEPIEKIATDSGKQCYRYTTAKDTVVLKFEKTGNEVTGELRYQYFEKDRNNGIIKGKMVGDTLFADYTFNSEGRSSVREVAFLLQENSFVEGYAEVEEIGGKFKFKENASFTWNNTMPLKKMDCANL